MPKSLMHWVQVYFVSFKTERSVEMRCGSIRVQSWPNSHILLSSFPEESSQHESISASLLGWLLTLLEHNQQPPGCWTLPTDQFMLHEEQYETECMSYSSVIVALLSRATPEILHNVDSAKVPMSRFDSTGLRCAVIMRTRNMNTKVHRYKCQCVTSLD